MGGRIALLIGTGSFEVDALPQLHTPAADVRELAAVLRDPYAGGFDPVIELIDADTQQVAREIALTLDRCRRDDLVLLYFSGYALLDEEGQLHLAMRDSEFDRLSPTSISAAFVAAELAGSRSRKQLLLLDCRPGSGFAHGAQELPAPQPPDAPQLVSAFHADGQPRVVLAGCKKLDALDEGAQPSEPASSAFTQALVSGMRGAADGDGDGRISIDDLYTYVAAQHAQPTARAGDAIGTQLIANATPRSSAAPRISNAPRGPKPGSLISDRYRIISVLAERGLGVVCSAIDETNGRHVSIRCLRPPQSSESNTLQRFLREAEVLGAIDHPALLTIYDVGFERSTAFMVMEPLAGESLAALLRRQQRLGIRETLEIVMRATAAISAAHARRVIHRDLNPEHIFVGRAPNGTVAQVKVLGFGGSTLLDDADLAGARGLIGSPHYMAPEQVLGSDPLDVRADVYAFGVIMYEALTGHRPFEADNHGALLFKISRETPRPLSEWVPDLPAALEAIVLKAMARDRTARFADVENLRLALFESGIEQGWIRTSTPPPLPARQVLQPAYVPKINTPLVFDRPSSTLAPRSRRWPVAVALGTLVAGGAVWALMVPQPHRPAVTVTPLAQPKDPPPPAAQPAAVAVAPEPERPPSATPEPAAGSTAAEPAAVVAAIDPPAKGATEDAAGGWRAQVHALAAERQAAREAKARERAEAAAAAVAAREAKVRERAAAAEARAAAAAEAREAKIRERAEAQAAAEEAREAKVRERAAAQAAAEEARETKARERAATQAAAEEARETKVRERAAAAEARAAAAAAAAEARAEARAEAAAIREATRKANQAWAADLKQTSAQAQRQSKARPGELPELKPTPQPSAAAEITRAQAPKPEPVQAQAGPQ